MTTTESQAQKPQEGLGLFVGRTNSEGLVFETTIPDTHAVREFLGIEARRAGITVAELQRRVAERGFAYYVLDELRAGHLTETETANLLGVHYTDLYRMAYSSGALEFPPGVAAFLSGDRDDFVKALRSSVDAPDLVVQEISYESSVEALSPLYAEVVYKPKHKRAPVLVVQHGGLPGSRIGMLPQCCDFARQGFFCIAVSKRGRDGSANQGDVDGSDAGGDAFCRETMDIVDAVDYCIQEYGDYLDPDSISIYGTSAGGMDALACVVHYPDTFRCAVAMFGPPDVWALVDFLKSDSPGYEWAGPNAPDHVVESGRLERHRGADEQIKDVGGSIDEWPDRWLVRDLSRYGANNPYTRTFFVWDEEDGLASKKFFLDGIERYLSEQRRRGYVNSEVIRSHVGDPIRYLHFSNSDQRLLYHRFVPALLSGTFPKPVLSRVGRLVVPGFVRTKPFTVWLGRGDDAIASLEYELGGAGGTFRFRRLSRDPGVRGRLTLHRDDGDKEIEFGLDDTVRVPED